MKTAIHKFLLTAAMLTTASFAQAYALDGKDATSTGCYLDAITANSSKYTGIYYIVRVELRYSPKCKTNWARIYYENKSSTLDKNLDRLLVPEFKRLVIERVTGRYVTYSSFNPGKEGAYFTPMIYAPNDTAKATLTFYDKYVNGNGYAQNSSKLSIISTQR